MRHSRTAQWLIIHGRPPKAPFTPDGAIGAEADPHPHPGP